MNQPQVLNYDIRANRHRPADATALAAEVRRLAHGGLMPNDIAQALRLDPASVRTMLGQEGKS